MRDALATFRTRIVTTEIAPDGVRREGGVGVVFTMRL